MPKLELMPDKPKPKRVDYLRVYKELDVAIAAISGKDARAESCPFCDKDKFYIGIETGQYDCKHCGEKGNLTTFLTWYHREYLSLTTNQHYIQLEKKRGIAWRTLKLHGLAYHAADDGWLIPFKNAKGNIVNLMRYYPNKKTKPNKYMLPELPTSIYGFHKLAHCKKGIPILLCEGPLDAIALDYNIGSENRAKYCVVATPGAFKQEWAEYFNGHKVRVLYDNDKGGQQQSKRVAKLLIEDPIANKQDQIADELSILKWPDGFPDGFDINDLVKSKADIKVVGWAVEHSYKVTTEPKLIVYHGKRSSSEDPPTDWIWPHHLFCGTYASFSGRQGTFKSSIMGEIAARYTTGREMPTMRDNKISWEKVEMPAGHVLYIFAEDDRVRVENTFEWAGGDFDKFHSIPAVIRDGDTLNVLSHLREIEGLIREFGIRLVIIDGQNSVMGTPIISTDMQARVNVSNKLHHFAQRLRICLVGIRNEDQEGRAYGPASMGDISRCVLRAWEIEPKSDPPYCNLEFVKVSPTARANYPTIPYSVKDHGGSHLEILWGKRRPEERDAAKAEEMAKDAPVAANRIKDKLHEGNGWHP